MLTPILINIMFRSLRLHSSENAVFTVTRDSGPYFEAPFTSTLLHRISLKGRL